jgi:hypothetical protein
MQKEERQNVTIANVNLEWRGPGPSLAFVFVISFSYHSIFPPYVARQRSMICAPLLKASNVFFSF